MRLTGTPSWLSNRRRERAARVDRTAGIEFERPPARLWGIGGGKGGIGKTFLAANLAAIAAGAGRRVILIDADLEGANLHTCLGVKAGARVNLWDYLEERIADLEKAAVDTPVPGLRLILGALGHAGQADTSQERRTQLLAAVRELPVDLVIFDLAAGTGRAAVDLFLESDESVLVTTPEPTAVENAYGFLRAAFFRRLSAALRTSPVRELVRAAMSQRNERGIRTPADLLLEVDRLDPDEHARCRKTLEELRPRLILNQVRNTEEIKLGFSIRSVCRRYFGLDVDYVGYVNYDDFAWRSIKERRALAVAYPQSDGALYIRQIAKKMLRV